MTDMNAETHRQDLMGWDITESAVADYAAKIIHA
jgi:hypothetical protein